MKAVGKEPYITQVSCSFAAISKTNKHFLGNRCLLKYLVSYSSWIHIKLRYLFCLITELWLILCFSSAFWCCQNFKGKFAKRFTSPMNETSRTLYFNCVWLRFRANGLTETPTIGFALCMYPTIRFVWVFIDTVIRERPYLKIKCKANGIHYITLNVAFTSI